MPLELNLYNQEVLNLGEYGTRIVLLSGDIDLSPYSTKQDLSTNISSLSNTDIILASNIATISAVNNTLNSNLSSLSGIVIVNSSNLSELSSNVLIISSNLSSLSSSVLIISSNLTSLSSFAVATARNSSNYLPLSGGLLTGVLGLSARNNIETGALTMYLSTVNAGWLPVTLSAAVLFNTLGVPEEGFTVPRIAIRLGRFDVDPDGVFNRSELRVSGTAQFNIFNKTSLRFYLRINDNLGFTAGDGLTNTATGGNSFVAGGSANSATGSNSHVEGTNNTSSGFSSHVEGNNNLAIGRFSHVEGASNIASGEVSHAAGSSSHAAHSNAWVWGGSSNLSTTARVSSTITNQFLVSAENGIFFPGNVGIGTSNNTNALTVAGTISASSPLRFRNTTTLPSITSEPISWLDIFVADVAYKLPLYQ